MVISEVNSCFDEGFYNTDESRILALQSKNTMNYLKVLGALCAFALTALTVNATVWTVSNNADRPAQFTGIQAAIDAASPGDTLLITGGQYNGTLTMVKNLVIYGESIEASEFPITYIYGTLNINRFNSSLSASGSRFYGLQFSTVTISGNFSGAGAGQKTIDDIIFERCTFLSTINQFPEDQLSNITYRNCLFKNNTIYATYYSANLSNMLMTNCVFDNVNFTDDSFGGATDVNGNIVVRNSMFLNRTFNCFNALAEMVLENNIFYKAEPTGLVTSTFNNNLTYLCNSNTIPYGNNIGSGNIVNQAPELTNYPALGAAHSWSWDYTPQAGSPCLGNGTNGSDIGISGGNAPVANLPRYAKIPGVTLLDIPVSSVPVGGTLQINIEAESRD